MEFYINNIFVSHDVNVSVRDVKQGIILNWLHSSDRLYTVILYEHRVTNHAIIRDYNYSCYPIHWLVVNIPSDQIVLADTIYDYLEPTLINNQTGTYYLEIHIQKEHIPPEAELFTTNRNEFAVSYLLGQYDLDFYLGTCFRVIP